MSARIGGALGAEGRKALFAVDGAPYDLFGVPGSLVGDVEDDDGG